MTKKIRVANILEEGKLGGPQVRVTNIACALKDQVETTVIMPDENSERFRAKLDECNIRYKVMNLTRLTKEYSVLFRYLIFSISEVIKLALFIRKEGFDLVHVSGGSWQYKGIIAAKLAHCKVVWHLNDTYVPLIVRLIFSQLSRFADGYIYSSKRTMSYYSPFIKSEKAMNAIVKPPVDTNYFLPYYKSSSTNNLNEKYKNKIVISTVANVNPVKNIELFIEVAAIVNKNIDNVIFLVIGSVTKNQRPYYDKLKLLIDNYVIENLVFVGAVNNVKDYLDITEIYLCTSHYESGPMTLWEAMSMECCIVSTDVGDVSEFIIPGKSGEIVAVDDANSMAQKVIEMLESSDLRQLYKSGAREVVVEKLDISISAEDQYQAYKKLCS